MSHMSTPGARCGEMTGTGAIPAIRQPNINGNTRSSMKERRHDEL